MLRSMTACGRAQKCTAGMELAIEIQSHNKRGLDIFIKLPSALSFLDSFIRKAMQQELGRGAVTVSVQAVFTDNLPCDVTLNAAFIEKVKKAAPGLALEILLPIAAREFPLFQIAATAGQEQLVEEALAPILQNALAVFQEMRAHEGALIAEEFEGRLKTLEGIVRAIKGFAGGTEDKYRLKLQKRLQELLPEMSHDERVAKEIAILAEKLDVSEELSRLTMHIASFRATLEMPQSEGKKLEFIVQEMLRELNTIGSKAQDGLIVEQVIEGKCEIEKIREQVMNVE